MAETQEATTGYMGEFHWHNGTTLYELHEVVEFDIPDEGAREQVEKTHLKSPDNRREYLDTFFEDSDFEVVLNTRMLSTTDTMLAADKASGTERAFKAVIPEDGEPAAQITGTAKCTGYSRGRVTADGVLRATATFRIISLAAAAAYSA